jgi:hypothetical protein
MYLYTHIYIYIYVYQIPDIQCFTAIYFLRVNRDISPYGGTRPSRYFEPYDDDDVYLKKNYDKGVTKCNSTYKCRPAKGISKRVDIQLKDTDITYGGCWNDRAGSGFSPFNMKGIFYMDTN